MGMLISRDETSQVFDSFKDSNETVYWVGKPNPVCFMMGGIPFLIFGIFWGGFDFFFLMQMMKSGKAMLGFGIPFLMLHSIPCWGSLLYMVWLFLAHNRTFYGYSNRRLMIKTGAIGTDIKTFDYDKISDLEVSVGPLESVFGVGSIRFDTGQAVSSNGRRIMSAFTAIPEPYEVFKKIKQISVDIKTDENYPNAMRPSENPGYNTKYEPKE
jgi:hypothetical protein